MCGGHYTSRVLFTWRIISLISTCFLGAINLQGKEKPSFLLMFYLLYLASCAGYIARSHCTLIYKKPIFVFLNWFVRVGCTTESQILSHKCLKTKETVTLNCSWTLNLVSSAFWLDQNKIWESPLNNFVQGSALMTILRQQKMSWRVLKDRFWNTVLMMFYFKSVFYLSTLKLVVGQ